MSEDLDNVGVFSSPSACLSDEKRVLSDHSTRRRLYNKDDKSLHKSSRDGVKGKERWQAHRITEDYVNVVGDIMYPKKQYGPFGYDSEPGRMTLSRVNSLGFLTNPLRKRRPIENWSPYELSVFEAAMMLYGKNFHQIHKHVGTKSTKEVIELYYDWKKTSHYKQWKKNYVPDIRDTPIVINENEPSSTTVETVQVKP